MGESLDRESEWKVWLEIAMLGVPGDGQTALECDHNTDHLHHTSVRNHNYNYVALRILGSVTST